MAERIGPEPEEGIKRPDQLPSTFDYFHDRGVTVEWWPHDGGGYWFLASYAMVVAAACDSDTFSSRHDVPNGTSPYLGVMLPPAPIDAIPLEMDPPEHSVLRSVLRPRFSVRAMAALKTKIQELVDECIDKHLTTGRMDLYHDLIKVVCATTVLDLVGVSNDDAATIADAMQLSDAGPAKFQETWMQLVTDVAASTAESRKEPGSHLIGDMCRAGVSDEDIMKVALTLVLGGSTSPVKLLYDAFLHLGRNVDDRRKLVVNPDLISVAVEEFLRVFSPTEMIARTATRDVVLDGQLIRAGDRVVLGYGAANRDPSQFANPNVIHFNRRPNHIAMGKGPHHCLGSALGRLECRATIAGVLRRIADFELQPVADRPRGLPGEIPVVFEPRAVTSRA
jgi:cytochrome P450